MSNFVERLFSRRPRVLNALHSVSLVKPTSQTIPVELNALERYATGACQALEIGTDQGVSAARIARALAPTGRLYCVDPWPEGDRGEHPCLSICQRHLRRSGVKSRVRILRGYSREMMDRIPDKLDFAFVDGDHSWEGVKIDWTVVSQKMILGGVVCLHDSLVPVGEDWRYLDSCVYFEDVIRADSRFSVIDEVHSLAVLRKIR
jgi:predicted O-methyltransferase YrrM